MTAVLFVVDLIKVHTADIYPGNWVKFAAVK